MVKQDFIPTGLRRELDGRIAATGGDVAKVRREVEAELLALEQRDPAPDHQVQVALRRGELLYLDSLITAATEATEQPTANLWQRLRNLFRRNKEAIA